MTRGGHYRLDITFSENAMSLPATCPTATLVAEATRRVLPVLDGGATFDSLPPKCPPQW